MSQHDMTLDNASGLGFRSDANNALQALASQSSGASSPSQTFPCQVWGDTSTGRLKQRNAANTAWLDKGPLDSPLRDAASQGEYAADTGAAGAYVCNFVPALTARSESTPLRFKAANANPGACTINDGLGTVALVGGAHSALQGGEIIANGIAWIQWNASIGGGSYVLLFCTGAAEQVGQASKSQHAVPLGQLQQNYAWNKGFQSLTASGNFTVPANVYYLDVEVWSGGGAGGGTGTASQTAGGGGGGGYARSIIAVTPGQVIACTIGAGGIAAAGTAGGAGGTSAFGGSISITGGGGGQPNPSGSGGVGGAPTGGTISMSGAGGGSGISSVNGGSGGGSPFGGVGGQGGTTVPSAAAGPGAGGGGRGGGSTGAGGSGMPGLINIRW